ncbi:MAG TPA: TlpA disulfide reductase family protein [Pyrinomonadaceae bacterium]|nr:TlpA disulfide reductase family protein [Pyrinomonadaceae bacterium]
MLSAVHVLKLCTAITLVLIGLSAIACTGQSGDDQPTPVLSSAPSTTFPMPPVTPNAEMGWVLADGTRSRLADHANKVLVVDFYATWCQPCRQSIPHLASMQARLGDSGLQVVGLNVGGADDRVKVPAFARELKIEYPLGFPDKTLSDFFLSDNQTIPQTFVFGRDGSLINRFIGYDPAIGNELEKTIQGALKKQTEN